MGVVFDGKAEVARRRLIREFDNIFTRTEQFDDDERQIGKTERVGCFLLGQETRKGPRIRLWRKLGITLGRDLDDPVPPLGRTDHASQGGYLFTMEKTRCHIVCCDHEVLNDLLGSVRFIYL